MIHDWSMVQVGFRVNRFRRMSFEAYASLIKYSLNHR